MRKQLFFFCLFLFQKQLLFGQLPTHGLVASWQFNNNFEDEGPHHIYSYPKNVKLGEDRFGQPDHAMLLDTTHACLVVPDHPALHVRNFTWSFWLLASEPLGEFQHIMGKRLDVLRFRYSFTIYFRNGTLNSYVNNTVGEETYVRSSLWVPKLHTWHHLAVVGDYNLSNYAIYADGVQIGRVDLNVVQDYDNSPLTFGTMMFRGLTAEISFQGKMDDFRLYDRGLTAEEIQRLAADRPEGKPLGIDWMKKPLPDGKYLVLYTEKDKIISPKPFAFELVQSRPVWQNPWFVVGSLFFTCLLTFFGMRRRQIQAARLRQSELEKFKAIEQERSRIARDLHDDLGSGLSAIGLLTEIAYQKSGDGNLNSEIKKMVETSTELSRKIREIIWMVSARFDNLENLVSYLHHTATELFSDSKIDLEVHLPHEMPAVLLGGEQRRAFFQAVKSALILLRDHSAGRVGMFFLVGQNFEMNLRFAASEIFSEALEKPTNFKLAIEKLKETGSGFQLNLGENPGIKFIIPISKK